MGDPSTLQMMEQGELSAFKLLTSVENRSLLDQTIQTYGSMGMCSYSTIAMMYNQQVKASKQSLSW